MAYKIYFDINVLLDLTLQRSNFNEVELIMNEIPALFDQFPRGSLSLQGVELLVDKIISLLK